MRTAAQDPVRIAVDRACPRGRYVPIFGVETYSTYSTSEGVTRAMKLTIIPALLRCFKERCWRIRALSNPNIFVCESVVQHRLEGATHPTEGCL